MLTQIALTTHVRATEADITLLFQVKRWRLREVKQLTQRHTASTWQYVSPPAAAVSVILFRATRTTLFGKRGLPKLSDPEKCVACVTEKRF